MNLRQITRSALSYRSLAALFLLALGARLLVLYELRGLATQHSLVLDAQRYDELARQILAGSWIPREPFYMAPAYPYFLAVTYAVFGVSIAAVQWVQSALGACTAVLLALVGSSLWSAEGEGVTRRRWTGLVAGVFAGLYGPALLYNALLLKTVPVLLLESVGLVLLLAAGARRRGVTVLLAGIAFGAASLFQETLHALAPVVALWLLFESSQRRGWTRVARVGMLALGWSLALVPTALLNAAAGGTPMPVSSQSGVNFYVGNTRGADGTFRWLSDRGQDPTRYRAEAQRIAAQLATEQEGREVPPSGLSENGVSRIFYREAFREIRADPRAWARLLTRKARLFWNNYEIPDAEGSGVYQRESLALLFDPIVFGLLAPLALVGFLRLVRTPGTERRAALLLGGMAVTVWGLLELFFVLARYRLAVVPFLVPLAAAGLVELVELWRAARSKAASEPPLGRRAAIDLGLGVALATLAMVPCFPADEVLRREASVENNLGVAAVAWAEQIYARAKSNSDNSRAMGNDRGSAIALALDVLAKAVAHFDAARHAFPFFPADLGWVTAKQRRSTYLAALGRFEPAIVELESAQAELKPALARLPETADPEQLAAARSALRALADALAQLRSNQALQWLAEGAPERAERALIAVTEAEPTLAAPRGDLALCRLELGKAAARRGATQEAGLHFAQSRADYELATKLADAGQRDDLAALYRNGLKQVEEAERAGAH